MIDHLRHILFPLTVGLLISSCSTDDEPVASGCEMKFEISGVSRSTVTTASNITGNPFVVFGDIVNLPSTENPYPSPFVILDATEIAYVNSAWTIPSTIYWFPAREHSFVAVHPSSVVSGTPYDTHSYEDSRLSFTYTLPADYKLVPDILVATHRRLYYPSGMSGDAKTDAGKAAPVALRFDHLLSRISLAPALDDNVMSDKSYLLVHRVDFTGIRTRATFGITPASRLTTNQTDDRLVDYEHEQTTDNRTINFSPAVKIVNNATNVNLFTDEAVLMLPQSFESNPDAKIVFYYTINDDPTMMQLALSLKDQTWEPGKNYGYRLSISRTGLKLESTTISNWEELDAGDIDVR